MLLVNDLQIASLSPGFKEDGNYEGHKKRGDLG